MFHEAGRIQLVRVAGQEELDLVADPMIGNELAAELEELDHNAATWVNNELAAQTVIVKLAIDTLYQAGGIQLVRELLGYMVAAIMIEDELPTTQAEMSHIAAMVANELATRQEEVDLIDAMVANELSSQADIDVLYNAGGIELVREVLGPMVAAILIGNELAAAEELERMAAMVENELVAAREELEHMAAMFANEPAAEVPQVAVGDLLVDPPDFFGVPPY